MGHRMTSEMGHQMTPVNMGHRMSFSCGSQNVLQLWVTNDLSDLYLYCPLT